MTLNVDIRHAFQDFALNATFEVGAGVTALFGPSGAGKSTIAAAITGLLRPDAGRITLNDEVLFDHAAGISVPVHRRRIGVVFQDGRLFPHLDVAGNLAFGARYVRDAGPAPDADAIARMLGIEALMTRRTGTLSGGEKQRVAIARALLMRPRLLIMDEPLAALDGPRKDEILPYLERLRDAGGVPIVYVSHAVAEIARLANSMVVLREGRVLRTGDVTEVLSEPSMVPLIGVREAGAVLHARVAEVDAGGLACLTISGGTLRVPGVGMTKGQALRIRILAQDVLIALEHPRGMSSRNILPAVVEGLHRGDGPGVAVALRLGGDRLLARITADAADELALRPGLACFAILKATAVARADIGVGTVDA
jgi:molybdate transport system ATP-binding protein